MGSERIFGIIVMQKSSKMVAKFLQKGVDAYENWSLSLNKRRSVSMSVFEALTLAISFAVLVLKIIDINQKNNHL